MIERVPVASIVAVVLIFAIGIVAFNSVTDTISGPQSSANMNCTMNTGDTVFNVIGIVLVIGVVMSIIGLMFYWVSTPQRYGKPSKILQFLITSTVYFGYGLLSLVIIVVPGYFIWFLWNFTVVEGNVGPFVDVLKLAVIFVVGYFGIAGLGYVFKKYFFDKWFERRKEREYSETMKELPSVHKEAD